MGGISDGAAKSASVYVFLSQSLVSSRLMESICGIRIVFRLRLIWFIIIDKEFLQFLAHSY